MKAISVKQPWAELIASGRKTIEVRSWRTDYRGPLLIVASSQPNREACADFDMRDLPCGVAICTVRLVKIETVARMRRAGVRVDDRACWSPPGDEYAWALADVRRVHPIRIKGRLRLYDVDMFLPLALYPADEGR